MGVTVHIEGLAELEDALLNRSVEDARKGMRAGLKNAGKWMAAKIADRAPVLRGFLKTHIVAKVSLSAKKDQGTVSVGPTKDAYYAQFVEFGSVHNEPPRPFIRPAFDENAEGWLEIFAQKLREALKL